MSEYVAAYLSHGLELSQAGKNDAKGTCPFCDKPRHFYVNPANGQANCKSCGWKGNLVTFLKQVYNESVKATTNDQLYEIAAERGLKIATLQRWGVAVSRLTGEVIIPAYNEKKKFANLYRQTEIEGKKILASTGTCKIHPFGVNLRGTKTLNKKPRFNWVTEGPWDGMALEEMLSQIRADGGDLTKPKKTNKKERSLLAQSHILAVPGCATFKTEWVQHYVDGQDTIICFDNDHRRQRRGQKEETAPGWDGAMRIAQICEAESHKPAALRILKWGPEGYNPDLEDGYDIRDLIMDEDLLPAYNTIITNLVKHEFNTASAQITNGKLETEEEDLEPLPCNTVEELIEVISQYLHFSPEMRDTLLMVLATVISTPMPGEQLFVRVIGPPGSGKTTLVASTFGCKELVFARSRFTGFHSGFIGKKSERGEDASLIPKMNGKTFIIKDGDTLLSAGGRDNLLAELRDIYDGSSSAEYRNRQSKIYNDLRITMLLCGTDDLRRLNRSSLGDRFIDTVIVGDEGSSDPLLDRAMDNAYEALQGSLAHEVPDDNEVKDLDRLRTIKRYTLGFLNNLKERITGQQVKLPTFSASAKKIVRALATLLGNLRARGHDREDLNEYRPTPEIATRLSGQMVKLAVCLAVVLNKKSVDNEVIRILRGRVRDTARGYRMEIVDHLFGSKTGKAIEEMELDLHIAKTNLRRLLLDMETFNVVTRTAVNNGSGARGRNKHVWKLTPDTRKLYRTGLGSH